MCIVKKTFSYDNVNNVVYSPTSNIKCSKPVPLLAHKPRRCIRLLLPVFILLSVNGTLSKVIGHGQNFLPPGSSTAVFWYHPPYWPCICTMRSTQAGNIIIIMSALIE
jgi:hypothetical protein